MDKAEKWITYYDLDLQIKIKWKDMEAISATSINLAVKMNEKELIKRKNWRVLIELVSDGKQSVHKVRLGNKVS